MRDWTNSCGDRRSRFRRPPAQIFSDHADFLVRLPKRGSDSIFIEVGADRLAAPEPRAVPGRRGARPLGHARQAPARRHGVQLRPRLQRLAVAGACRHRAADDRAADRPLPLCRHPWFSTAFGRDGVISALQMLWLDPALARGVLAFLAQHQATETSPFSDSQPGKIMHETRKGEMAVLRELPFGRYYGGVDTTPLYIYLACAYAARTGDMGFVDTLWPSLVAAAAWMEEASKQDDSGFVTYQRAAEFGLCQPGLEGQLRFRLPCRRPHPAWADRAGRGARLRLCRISRAGRSGCAARGCRRRRALDGLRRKDARRRSNDRSGWRTPASTRSRSTATGSPCRVRVIQCRASSLCRAALAGAGATPDRRSCWLRASIPAGGCERWPTTRSVQPDVLPQWLDLAARHGDLRGGHGALRIARKRRSG